MMINYRPMILLDIPILISLEREIFRESPWSTAQFKEELAGVPRTRHYLVAEVGGQIVGYAGIALAGDCADIHNIAVIPQYRGQGIASELMKRLESWAIEHGASALMLEMREGNTQALPLYEGRGYRTISRRDNYYAPGIHALIMRKEVKDV